MYLVLRKHLGVIGGHYRRIHNPNTKMTEISQNGQNGQKSQIISMVFGLPGRHVQVPKCIIQSLYGLNNTYMMLRKHLGIIGSHQTPIHDPNINLTKISQNGQNGQVNLDQVYDVYAIGYTYLDPNCIVKGLYGLNNMYRVLRKHLGIIKGHLEPIHDPNVNLTEISQNGQNGQVNLDQVQDVYATMDTCLDPQIPRKGSKQA